MTQKFHYHLLFILLIFSSMSYDYAAAETSNVTVEVTGAGATYDEAKADAIKKALQYAFKQLVIVDRIISNDDVLRDRVLSTSNGYVENFVEKKTEKTDLGYNVDAVITVSASRIENFLGVVAGGGGEISGSLISQEIQRQNAQNLAVKSQAKARQEIFERMFENYPMGAVELKLKKVNISPKNPNILLLDIEQSHKPGFVKMLEGTLRALSIHECKIPYNRRSSFFSLLSKRTLCPYNAGDKALAALLSPHLSASTDYKPTFAQVCIGYDDTRTAKCFLLDDGAYLSRNAINKASFQIVGRFVDANGQNALVNNQCIKLDRRVGNVQRSLGIRLDSRGLGTSVRGLGRRVKINSGFHLSTEKLAFQVEVDAAKVDVKRATHLVAVAGMMTRKGQFVGITSATGQSADPCGLVDDAVRQHMLSGTQ